MRATPGTGGQLLSTMPLDASGLIEFGPLPADGFDWYFIRYHFAVTGSLDLESGWVAYGPAETPWLTPTNEVIAGVTWPGAAGTGPGVVGPAEIGGPSGLRWAAVGEDCPLAVSINDVAVVSTRVHGFAEGEVSFLEDYPELVGTFDIEVETECAWTLSHGGYQG